MGCLSRGHTTKNTSVQEKRFGSPGRCFYDRYPGLRPGPSHWHREETISHSVCPPPVWAAWGHKLSDSIPIRPETLPHTSVSPPPPHRAG